MAKLRGLDLSHHNKNMADMHDINEFDFVIFKATEGASYRDRSLPVWLAHLNDEMLKGYYHFCRADLGNTPQQEADNFLGWIEYGIDGKSLLALDVEGAALRVKNIDQWCYEFAKYVFERTGIRILIYTSESYCHLFKKTASFGCGLWCAKWSENKPKKISPWKLCAIWQYTSKLYVSNVRCDGNFFFGSRTQYLKYCEDLRNGKSEDTDDTGD